MRIKIGVSVCAVALALGTPQARANGLAGGGTIIGIFSDPIYSGFVTHDPTISSPPVYFNNSATAPLSTFIVNSTDPTLAGTPPLQATGSKLQWGADALVDPSEQFSELIFFGAPIPANIHEPFEAGVITYLNGTSDLNSLIFGASLSLYDDVVSPETYLGTDTVIITTTSNLGVDLAQDADTSTFAAMAAIFAAAQSRRTKTPRVEQASPPILRGRSSAIRTSSSSTSRSRRTSWPRADW
jgi:hypothetical protein